MCMCVCACQMDTISQNKPHGRMSNISKWKHNQYYYYQHHRHYHHQRHRQFEHRFRCWCWCCCWWWCGIIVIDSCKQHPICCNDEPWFHCKLIASWKYFWKSHSIDSSFSSHHYHRHHPADFNCFLVALLMNDTFRKIAEGFEYGTHLMMLKTYCYNVASNNDSFPFHVLLRYHAATWFLHSRNNTIWCFKNIFPTSSRG